MVKKKYKTSKTPHFLTRRQWMLRLFILIIGVLLWRAVYLQVKSADFLQSQGNARYLRTLSIVAYRGMLMDRNGEPLAISTPVDSVWVNPSAFVTARFQWAKLTQLLGLKISDLEKVLVNRMRRKFVYVKRHISPSVAQQVMALKLPGVFLQREYHRYYPTREVSAHVLGFTNIDDQGQEGLELALNHFLKGTSGAKRVIQDKQGHIIAHLENIRIPRPGQNIHWIYTPGKYWQSLINPPIIPIIAKNFRQSVIVTGRLLMFLNQDQLLNHLLLLQPWKVANIPPQPILIHILVVCEWVNIRSAIAVIMV